MSRARWIVAAAWLFGVPLACSPERLRVLGGATEGGPPCPSDRASCDDPGGGAGGGCLAIDQPCADGASCCSGDCDPAARRCRALPVCDVATGVACSLEIGEPCASDDACCSRACRDDGAGGRRCGLAGGCFGACQRCAAPSDCCSNYCVIDPASGVGRCQPSTACVSDGAFCAPGDACCAGECRIESESGKARCAGDLGGGCRADGSACALAEQCCGGYCAPRADGIFTCRSTCSAEGEPCASATTCCDGAGRCARRGATFACTRAE